LKNFAHALGVMSGVASFTIMKSFYKTEAAILSMQAMLPLTSKPTIAVKRRHNLVKLQVRDIKPE